MLFFVTNCKYVIKHYWSSCEEYLFLIEVNVFSATEKIKWFFSKQI